MKVRIANSVDDIERLRPLAEEWKEACNSEDFGMKADVESFLIECYELIDGEDSDLLILDKDNETVGLMGLTTFKNPICDGLVANEHFWFVAEGNRGYRTMSLIRAAQKWAEEKGCSHLILNASCLASDMHNRLCRFYEKIGFKKFETSFIKEIT